MVMIYLSDKAVETIDEMIKESPFPEMDRSAFILGVMQERHAAIKKYKDLKK